MTFLFQVDQIKQKVAGNQTSKNSNEPRSTFFIAKEEKEGEILDSALYGDDWSLDEEEGGAGAGAGEKDKYGECCCYC